MSGLEVQLGKAADKLKQANWKQLLFVWLIIITLVVGAIYTGGQINLEVEVHEVVRSILEQEINSTFSLLQKSYSYVVSQVGSYYCMQNGATGKLDDYDTNLTLVQEWANGNLTSGGTIFVKELQWNTSITIGANILVIEDYQGTRKLYNDISMAGYEIQFAAFHTGSTPPSNPTIGQWFYDTDDYKLYVWNSTHWDTLGVGGTGPAGPAGAGNFGDYEFIVYQNGSNTEFRDWQGQLQASGTNDAQIINWAIGNTTASYTRETVVLQGIFSLSSSISISKKNIILDLSDGRLEVDANVHAITVSSTHHVVIYGGVIDGNKASRSGDLYGIYITGTSNHILIDNVEVRETNKYGIYATGLYHSTIQNCYMYRCGDNSVSLIGGIYLDGLGSAIHDVDILNNYLDNNGDTGGRMLCVINFPETGNGPEDIRIIGNTFVGLYEKGSNDKAILLDDGQNCVVANNIVIGDADWTETGIDVQGNHISIMGNYVEQVGDHGYCAGIHVTGVTSNFAVVGNVMYNCTRGILVGAHEYEDSTAHVISGNDIDGGTRGAYGIVGCAHRSIITGNNIRNIRSGSARGIAIYWLTGQISVYSMVHSNYVENCGVGIYENNCAYLSIQGNVIKNCTTYMTLENDGSHHVIADNVDWHA